MGHVKGCFGHWQLGIRHLGVRNSLQWFASVTTKQKLRSAQFLKSKATVIESAMNTQRFFVQEALESSSILISVLLWSEELQLCHETVLSY